ncbi:MAG: endonuclease MutS2 [Candidatus Latescibacteria bacterium]|nr:endonuclease MutS2 [Candidatus Latescibacterota bacterium]
MESCSILNLPCPSCKISRNMVDEHTSQTLEFDKVVLRIAGHTASAMGREEVLALAPVGDLEIIGQRIGRAVEMADLIGFDDPIPARGIPDIRRALARCGAEGIALSTEELWQIGEALSAFQQLRDYLDRRREKYPALLRMVEWLTPHPEVEEAIGKAIGPEGEVRDSASPELGRIRRERERVRSDLREKLERLVSSLPSETVQDRLVTLREGRFVIPVREGHQRNVPGIVHDQSDSGATVFVEPLATVEMGNRLRQLDVAEVREIERILRALTDRVRAVREDLFGNVEVFGRFDAVYAIAVFCREVEAHPPSLNTEGRIVLRGARHPLLVLRARESGQGQKVVPLDVSLGERFRTLVLTGPNAGGKTVALKTVGLLTLMACAGLPVPAHLGSEIATFRQVFADIGDEQSIENDLSTFSSHVRRLARICAEADGETLILLDEVGGSTDPDEGAALAMALLEDLTRRGARTVATTHHGALKAFAHQSEGVENGSMEFDGETLTPTFRLRLSIPGSSYAFEIARRWGMPEGIVEDAIRRVGGKTRQVERLIAGLDQSYQEYRQRSEDLARQQGEIAQLRQEFEEKLADLEMQRRALRKSVLQESERILSEANALIERTVADIRREAASRESIQEGKKAVQEALVRVQAQVEQDRRQQASEGPDPEIGDYVWIERFGKEGVVLSGRNAAGRVRVQVGNVKVEVSPSEIKKVEGRSVPSARESVGGGVRTPAGGDLPTSVDLRGMTFEEAAEVVDRFLDDAFLARMGLATLIHGKGTGALRQKLGAYLKTHPRIRSQRLGNWNEGGSGVTIVEIEQG